MAPTRFLSWTAVLTSILLAMPSAAQTVVDGATIKIGDVTWRLWGVDAPTSEQWCGRYPAGILAEEALTRLVRSRKVVCEARGIDVLGRMIGACRADGIDLSKAMVQAGYAWAFTTYSRDYVEVEDQARAHNLGVHAYRCRPGWEWRSQEQR